MSACIRCVRVLSLNLLFAIALSISAQADDFLSVLPDVPLPSKMSELVDSQMDFDSAAGRIIQVAASGNASQSSVKEFYRVTLPQLGWMPKSNEIYSRELEQLKLSFSAEGTLTIVQFELSPKSAAPSN